jgi:long-subunit fatty acid transport protein
MLRRIPAIALVPLVLAVLPRLAHAGGPEFPAGGTRSLGRGAAGFARADDPSVMVRNPALLADLWDDQAMLGAHLLLPKACFQPTGTYAWGVQSTPPDVSDFGNGPVVLNPPTGAKDTKGNPLVGYGNDPLPRVCYGGPAPFLPQVGVSMKLTPDLGVGFGFFPPDAAGLRQWGNRDGTVDTPNGKRPNPLRFEGPAGSLESITFFSLLGAVGYRVADWIRVGGGFQWNAVAYQTRSWTAALPSQLNPNTNARADTFGRDLFIPGMIASLQVKPVDNLDIAVGFRWSDHLKNNAKLDVTNGAFGTGQVFPYVDAGGQMQTLGSTIPKTTNNQRIFVRAPPIWVPQLSLGIRYADRLKPPPQDRAKAHAVAGGVVEDHMLTERWDIELDGVYYFTSQYDATVVTAQTAQSKTVQIAPDGMITSKDFAVGKCPVPLVEMGGNHVCSSPTRILRFPYEGKNQMSVRLGGDYNVLPGLLALRAGVSYETDGEKVQFLEAMNYMLSRVGLHGGFTLRVANKTDISFGFAHFIQKHVKLQVNDSGAAYPASYQKPENHFQPGLGVGTDASGNPVTARNSFAGVAQQEVPNGSPTGVLTDPPANFINAGSYHMSLDVLSLSFTQHF